MTGPNLPADVLLRLEQMESDIRNLYRQRNGEVGERGITEIPFSLAGKVLVSTSPPYYCSPAATVRRWTASLATAGTVATTVRLYKNNVIVATITLNAGVKFVRQVVDVNYSADSDEMRVGVTATGGGASDLTVQVRMTVGREWSMSPAR